MTKQWPVVLFNLALEPLKQRKLSQGSSQGIYIESWTLEWPASRGERRKCQIENDHRHKRKKGPRGISTLRRRCRMRLVRDRMGGCGTASVFGPLVIPYDIVEVAVVPHF